MSLGRAGSAVRDGIVNSLTALTKIEGEIIEDRPDALWSRATIGNVPEGDR